MKVQAKPIYRVLIQDSPNYRRAQVVKRNERWITAIGLGIFFLLMFGTFAIGLGNLPR